MSICEKLRLEGENFDVSPNKLCICTLRMAFTCQSRNLHIMAGIFSIDDLYIAGKTPLLVENMLVNFGDKSCQKQAEAVNAVILVGIPT